MGTATLEPGNVETISGTTISVGASWSYVVIDGKTHNLSPGAVKTHGTDNTYVTNDSGNVIIGTATFHPGEVETVSGTTFSMGEDESYMIVNGKTTALTATTRGPNSASVSQATGNNGKGSPVHTGHTKTSVEAASTKNGAALSRVSMARTGRFTWSIISIMYFLLSF